MEKNSTDFFDPIRCVYVDALLGQRGGILRQIWAIAHRLCRVVWKILHEGVQFIEQSPEVGLEKRRNVPKCWREPFVGSAMRLPSPP
jgi:hypothetical protein